MDHVDPSLCRLHVWIRVDVEIGLETRKDIIKWGNQVLKRGKGNRSHEIQKPGWLSFREWYNRRSEE